MMMTMPRACFLVALVGCASEPTGLPTVVGPFDGAPHRFVVDAITLPTTTEARHQMSDDLDGDGSLDNQLGNAVGLLASEGDVTTHAADMIASGVLASSVIIRSDDLMDDLHAGISVLGADGDADVPFGGKFIGGAFQSNRARSKAPGQATLRIPFFTDADPLVMPTTTLEIELVPDATGYLATIHGGFPVDDVIPEMSVGMLAMLKADPNHHLSFARSLDTNKDGLFSVDEIRANSLVQALTFSDVELGGVMQVSFGFQLHLKPCAAGKCLAGPAADTCSDRILDGDETAVDCGGGCNPCPGASACTVAADCQSNACNGTCAAPSCTDGVVSGFESGPDCGGNTCPACASGVHCVFDADCLGMRCDATTSTCQ